MRIKLTKQQFEYLRSTFFLKREDLIKSIKFEQVGQKVYLELDKEFVDEIRDWAGEKMQLVGFNKNYELTQEGKVLEEIMDAFYT